MRLDIAPILSALRKHRVTAVLLVLQIACTCAIVCNAAFLVADRLRWMDTPSGIDEDRIATIDLSAPTKGTDMHARTMADLAALRAVPGVEAVSVINSVPFGDRSWNTGIRLDRDNKEPLMTVAIYQGENVGQIFGAELAEGRWLRPDEYVWIDDLVTGRTSTPHVMLITESVSRRLFAGASAVGKTIYMDDETYRVVGVVRWLASASPQRARVGDVVVMPWRNLPTYGASFVLRTAPGKAGSVLAPAAEALRRIDPRRVIADKKTYAEIRAHFFAPDRSLSAMLVGSCVILLAITALGIVGLASFWVAQRRRQIGVRRALGATRADVLRYFQTENFILASMGIGLGVVLAYAMNIVLMVHYEVARLPWGYLPVVAAILWLLGQLAVLAPALRAAAVPPVEATRG